MNVQIGRKIYYELSTGNIVLDTGERQGSVVPTTIEHDILTYKILSERNRDTIDVIELKFGQYEQDFAECTSFRVNLGTKNLEFSYPNPNEPEVEQPYQAPLTIEVESLKKDNQQLRLEMAQANTELFEMIIAMNGGIS